MIYIMIDLFPVQLPPEPTCPLEQMRPPEPTPFERIQEEIKTPLVYDPTFDISNVQTILFVHSSVSQLQVVSSASTFTVVYDFASSTDEVLALMDMFTGLEIQRIGFAFHYTGASSRFMNKDELFSESDLQGGVYSKNMQFMIDLINRFHVPHVDFFACNTLLDDSWKQYYQILQSETGVIVGASDDNTGNLKYGGDWIMESTQEDISQIYFTSAIVNFASLLLPYTDPASSNTVTYSYTVPASGTVGTASVLSANNSLPASYTIVPSFVYGGVTYSVTSIGDRAFLNCTKLTKITIPTSVTSITGDANFENCRLKTVDIPPGVTRLGGQVFKYNTLTSITIPDNITSIGDNAFSQCGQLTSITLSPNITKIPDYMLYGAYSLKEISIPSAVTSIGAYAFRGCSALKTIQIPSAVTSIGYEVFRECTEVTSATFLGTGLKTIADRAFFNCYALINITIPIGVTNISSYAFYNCASLTSLTLPSGLLSMGDFAFAQCASMRGQLTIPSGVTYIGMWIFNANPFTSLVFAEPVATNLVVADFAFRITKISYIDLSKTKLKTIPPQMFHGAANNLSAGKRTVLLPYGVTSVGLDSFNNFFDGFELIVIPNTITTLPSASFFFPYGSGVGMTYTCDKLIMFTSADDGVTNTYYHYVGTMPTMTSSGSIAFNNIITSFNANKTNTTLWSRSFFSAVNAFLPSVENVGVGDTFSVYFYYYVPGVTYSISGVLSSDLSGASLSDTIPEGPSTKMFTVTSGGTKTITFTTSDNYTASVYIKPIPYVAITPSASLIYPKPLGSAVLTGGSALSEIGGNVVAGSFRASPDVSNSVYNIGAYTDVPAVFYPDEINYYSNSSTVFEITINRATTTDLQTISVSPTALRNAGYTATELKDANISTTQLKTAGYTATELIEANVTTTDLKTVGYTATELKAANVSALELRTVGYTATQLKAANVSATDLKTVGYTATEMKAASITPTELKSVGFTATEMKAASITPTELKTAGFNASELIVASVTNAQLKTAGYTATELKAANVSTTDLKTVGYTATELKAASVSALEMRTVGYTATDLKTANVSALELKTVGYTATEMKAASITPTELKTVGFTATEMKAANITPTELKTAGFTASELIVASVTNAQLKTAGYTATELKAANVSTTDLKTVGYTATNLKTANVSALEMRTVGYTATELKSANITPTELKTVGFTATEMKAANISPSELKTAGFNATELIVASVTNAQLKTAGYTATELKAANVSTTQMKTVGYTATEMKGANISPTELKTVGFTATELKVANISTPQLKIAGYTATELKVANVSTTDLKTVGYTATELKTANISTTEMKTVGYTATELKSADISTIELKTVGFTPTELKTAGVSTPELYSVFTTPTEQKSVTKMVVTDLLVTTSKVVIPNPTQLVGYSFDPTIVSVLAVKVTDVTAPVAISRNELNNGSAAVYAVIDVCGSYVLLPTHSSQLKIMNVGNDKYKIFKEGVLVRENLVVGDTYTNDGTTVVIGSVTATMTKPPGIDFIFTDFLDLGFSLSADGTLSKLGASIPSGQYTLERDISISTMKNAFYFQTDDPITYDSSFTKYFVDISGWSATTMKYDLNPMSYQIKSGAFGINTTDNLGKHFLRYLAEKLFGTYLGVDLFENEDVVYSDISSNAFNYVYTPIVNKLKLVDKNFGSSPYGSRDSNNHFFMSDISGSFNICYSLMRQIIASNSGPERFQTLELRVGEGAGKGIYCVPFRSGDSIYYTVIISPDPNQHLITNLATAIDAKKYILKLNIV